LFAAAWGVSSGQFRSASKAADAEFQWRFIHPMHIYRVDLNLLVVLATVRAVIKVVSIPAARRPSDQRVIQLIRGRRPSR
jgi:hypothetical protein